MMLNDFGAYFQPERGARGGPETHAHGSERGATYALLVGFCVMLISDVLLG